MSKFTGAHQDSNPAGSGASPRVEAEIVIAADGKVTFVSLFKALLPVAEALNPKLVRDLAPRNLQENSHELPKL